MPIRPAAIVLLLLLAQMPPATFATNPVDLRATPTLTGARLRIAVRQPGSGSLVRRFATVHERAMHLFVVGEGLEFFAHEHPVQQPDGVFMIDVTLPRRGAYMAIAEFLPEGGTPQTFQQIFTTGSGFGRPARLGADLAPKIVDGMRFSLEAGSVHAGGRQALTVRIDDAATGAPVNDLERYLGASAHLLLVSQDLTEAIHDHPTEEERGPSVTFRPLLPHAGMFKAWIQVQRAGHVSTAAFVIDVP